MKSDPRVFFAAERTLLAWLRTGIAVMGVGFLVARFGLFLRMLHPESRELPPHPTSTLLGVTFVLIGAAAMALAAMQFTRFLRTLSPSDRPAHYWLASAAWYAFLISALGLLLAVYLTWGLAS